jgi:hypothetical protein
MNNDESVRIYEVLYDKRQQVTGEHVIPLSITNTNPEWRELQAYMEAYNSGLYRDSKFTGIFSPKFNLKTGVSVADFVLFASNYGEADVCFVNPFPQIAYWSFNAWMQGEYAHPGLISRAQDLLDAVGISWDISKTYPRHAPDVLAYSNYWVGTPQFWESYVGSILEPIARFLAEEPGHRASMQVLQSTFHTHPTPYLPFIIERLFSTFLTRQKDIRYVSYSFSLHDVIHGYCLNEFEQLLVRRMGEEVSRADAADQHAPELVEKMDLLTCLHQRHYFDYFQTHVHPHTGQVMELE